VVKKAVVHKLLDTEQRVAEVGELDACLPAAPVGLLSHKVDERAQVLGGGQVGGIGGEVDVDEVGETGPEDGVGEDAGDEARKKALGQAGGAVEAGGGVVVAEVGLMMGGGEEETRLGVEAEAEV